MLPLLWILAGRSLGVRVELEEPGCAGDAAPAEIPDALPIESPDAPASVSLAEMDWHPCPRQILEFKVAGEDGVRYRLVGEVSPEGPGEIAFEHVNGEHTVLGMDFLPDLRIALGDGDVLEGNEGQAKEEFIMPGLEQQDPTMYAQVLKVWEAHFSPAARAERRAYLEQLRSMVHPKHGNELKCLRAWSLRDASGEVLLDELVLDPPNGLPLDRLPVNVAYEELFTPAMGAIVPWMFKGHVIVNEPKLFAPPYTLFRAQDPPMVVTLMPMYSVTVKTPVAGTGPLEVQNICKMTTGAQLKVAIELQHGVTSTVFEPGQHYAEVKDKMVLLFAGQALEDDKPLSEYRIGEGSTITMMPKMGAGVSAMH